MTPQTVSIIEWWFLFMRLDPILRHMTSRPAFLVDSTTQASSCLSSFSEAAAVFGLCISWPKTKIQNVGSGPQPPSILVDGNPVDSVSTFTYLGSLQSSDGYCRPDVRMRADHFGLLSNVVFGLFLEGTPATPSHQNTRLSCSRPVCPTLCLRDMDSHFSRCQVPGGIPYEMPTQNL